MLFVWTEEHEKVKVSMFSLEH